MTVFELVSSRVCANVLKVLLEHETCLLSKIKPRINFDRDSNVVEHYYI